MEWIQTHGMGLNRLNRIIGINTNPIGLCTATIGYQFHNYAMLKRSFWCKSNKKFGELAENKEKKSNFASRIKRTLADYEKIIGILYIRIGHRYRGWRGTEGEGS